jgi:hypothetical protein
MTVPSLTFRVKPTANGEFEIEVSPTQFEPSEPVIVPMRYTCMPGASRRKNRDESGPKFSM